jgi:nitrite reductase (NADH) small subunit
VEGGGLKMPVGMLTDEVRVGPVGAIPPGEGRAFTVGGEAIAVFRTRDGALYATQDRCPHRDGPLSDGLVGGGVVVCPFHAYRFSLADGACLNDASCSIRTYPVRDEDGWVIVGVQALGVGR